MTFSLIPSVYPGPPVDPDDIAPVCHACGGRSTRAAPLGCECGDYGYIASVNSRRRFAGVIDAAVARHPLNQAEPLWLVA